MSRSSFTSINSVNMTFWYEFMTLLG